MTKVINDWVNEKCDTQSPESETRLITLYFYYKKWCIARDKWYLNKSGFEKALISLGFRRGKAGLIVFRGLSIIHLND
jgi:hypothetical protein